MPSDPLAEETAGANGQNLAVFTLETLARTLNGVTSPTTVTFFAAESMLKDVTPAKFRHTQQLSINFIRMT